MHPHMRAIIFDGTSVRLETGLPPPKPAAGEAVVRLRRAAVAPFDVSTARGQTAFRGVMGHQFVGVVESVHGDAAASRKLVNQRVVGSVVFSCGECDLCRKGLAVHCRQRSIMGMTGRDGCFAERFCVPVKQLAPVPNSVDDDRAVFAVDVASALHVAQQLTIVNRPYISIVGDGPLALIAGQIMSKMNASVRVVGSVPARLELCEKWGVKQRHIEEAGRRADQDIVIECSDAAHDAGLEAALAMVRPRGTVVLKSLSANIAGDGIVGALSAIVSGEINVIGSFIGSMSEAVAALGESRVDVLSLISRRVPLGEGVAAIKAAGQREAMKVLIVNDE